MIPSSPIWTTNNAEDPDSKQTTPSYIMGTLTKFTNTTDPDTNLDFLFNKLVRYIELHKELFGTYEGDLMHR